MRSNRRADSLALAAVVLALLLIGPLRASLSGSYRRLKDLTDAYLLPPPDETYVASLGYRAALADLIFGHVLVSYGLHFHERRLFERVGDYLDIINRLDPKFRTPYRYADTLLTLQPKVPPASFYRKAREIQERGLKELPYDQELWLTVGQYLAYVAPGRLTDPAEQEEYRHAGARDLMRACDLIGSNENIPYNCMTAAVLLNREGSRQALRSFLQRLAVISDDPEVQKVALSYLGRTLGEEARALVEERKRRFRDKWQADLPLSPQVEVEALGPAFDSGACAVLDRALSDGCASSWLRWASSGDKPAPP